MKRIPEPEELMNDAAQAKAYADEDFAEARDLFLDRFDRIHPDPFRGHALDLGCGPADIPIAFARRHPGARIDGLDAAEAMLAHARKAVSADTELSARIRLHCDYLPSAKLSGRHYDAVLSNSLLHHLADPQALWQSILACARPGATVLVMDLMRPADKAAVDDLVTRHAAHAPPVLRRDFENSLYAAYEIDEVLEQLTCAGLRGLEVTAVSDRHLAVAGRLPD